MMHQTHRPTHRFHTVTIVAVRNGILVSALLLLGPGCGREPSVPGPEHEALLQRLDAMDERLDALEDAIAPRPASEDLPPAPVAEVLERPAASAAAVAEAATPTLAVRITAGGGVELDGKAVAREDVLARFREVADKAPGTRLTVLAEPDVPYDVVVRTLDLAREAGLTDVAMSVRVHGEGAVEAGW
jgi:biopolymer transport protein ExbD